MDTRINYLDAQTYMKGHAHGWHDKDMIVLHETISQDIPGVGDIIGIEKFLARKNYGIHGMSDVEGHIAWAFGFGRAIFWQCGGVNERSIGIEQISNIPLRSPQNKVRASLWALRNKEIRATARLVAAIHNTKPHQVPLKFSNGLNPGVTTHWNVSQHFKESEGHTDCWPLHQGGYYPVLQVIALARIYAKTGVRL